MSAASALAAAHDVTAADETRTLPVDEPETKLNSAADADTVLAPDAAAADISPPDGATRHDAAVREESLNALRQSQALPPGLRERLVTLVAGTPHTSADGQPLLPVGDLVRAVEEGLPIPLRLGAAVARQPHPSGESFFQAGDGELSDAQAEAIARAQLERSGFLRGQRTERRG